MNHNASEWVALTGVFAWFALWAIAWNVVVVLAWFEALRTISRDFLIVRTGLKALRIIGVNLFIVRTRFGTLWRTLREVMQAVYWTRLETLWAAGGYVWFKLTWFKATWAIGRQILIICTWFVALWIASQNAAVPLTVIRWCWRTNRH